MNDNNFNQVPNNGTNQQNVNMVNMPTQMPVGNTSNPEIISPAPVANVEETELLVDESANNVVNSVPMNNGVNPGMANPMPMNNGVNPGMVNPMPMNNGVNPGMVNPMPMNNGVNPGMANPMPMNNGVNPGMTNSMPMNNGVNPMNMNGGMNQQPKSNTGLIIAIVIISVIVVALVAFISITAASKNGGSTGEPTTNEVGNNNTGDNNDDNTGANTIQNENTKQLTYGGYTFTVDKDVVYEIKSNLLMATNAANNVVVQLAPTGGSISVYESSKDEVISALQNSGYGSTTYSKATHDGRQYLVFKGSRENIPFEYYITALNSSSVLQGLIITKTGTEFSQAYTLIEDFVSDAVKSGSADSSSFNIQVPSTSDFSTNMQ